MSPLYDLGCECGYTTEVLLNIAGQVINCPKCEKELIRVYSAPPMVKMKGEGGYPSRRRQVFNTTSRNKPMLDSKATKEAVEAAKEKRL